MGHLRLFLSNTAPEPTQAARTQQCASEGAPPFFVDVDGGSIN